MKKTDNKPAYGQKKQTVSPGRGTMTGAGQSSDRGPIESSVDWEIPGDVPEKDRKSIYPYSPPINMGVRQNVGGSPTRVGAADRLAAERSPSSVKAQTSEIPDRRSALSMILSLIALALILGLSGFGYVHFTGDNDTPVTASVEHVEVSENAAMEDIPTVMQTVLSDVSEKQVIQAEQNIQPPLVDTTEEVAKPVQEPRIIAHVVKKGDTLWDIAEHYLNDPFKYPELAELSEIENPDLIYPGEIVRIRIS